MPLLAAPRLQQQQTAQQHQQTAKQLPQQQCHWQALSHALVGTLLSDYSVCQSRRQGTGVLEVRHGVNQLSADFASAKSLSSYFISLCKVAVMTGKALAAKGFLSTDPEKLELCHRSLSLLGSVLRNTLVASALPVFIATLHSDVK